MIKIIKYYQYNLITLTHAIQCLFDHMLVNSLIYNNSLPILRDIVNLILNF
jgi:hypothetical protein